MHEQDTKYCTAFEGNCRIASGNLEEVAKAVKEILDQGEHESVPIFDDCSGELVDVDFRGAMEDVMRRLEKTGTIGAPDVAPSGAGKRSHQGPGRPKLGVVGREVTLLPRHWDWLNDQPGGASVALRKLVEEARRVNSGRDRIRHAQEAAYRFTSAMAGDLPGFEEATRALFAGDHERFNGFVALWPSDIRDHARKISSAAFHPQTSGSD